MCLIVKRGTKRHTAKRNITVYKVLSYDVKDKCLCTPYIGRKIYFDYQDKALLGISKQQLFITLECMFTSVPLPVVEKGIHAWSTSHLASNAVNCGILHRPSFVYYAIIPKGEDYYYGVDGDIVASGMIIFKNEDAYRDYLDNN